LARATKKTTKINKYRPLKFFFHHSKLQAGSSKDDYQTKSRVIRAITRPRPTTACSGQLAVRQKAVMKREKAEPRTGTVWLLSSEMPACISERWKKNFNGRYFFCGFLFTTCNRFAYLPYNFEYNSQPLRIIYEIMR
jgi:hypothetical protein